MDLFKKTDPLDRLAIGSLAICGMLIALRFIFFDPADHKLIFEFPFVRSGNTLLFFVWNLFLAALPYFFIRLSEYSKNILLIALLFLLWLVFLPNAPYVISDLKHLRPRTNVPYWYDIITFLCCAITGLLLGGLAVIVAARRFQWQQWPNSLQKLSLLLFPLCGFGIYLGRVLRWNSWDILTNPTALFQDIFQLFTNTQTASAVFIYCVAYGLFLSIATICIPSLMAMKKLKRAQ